MDQHVMRVDPLFEGHGSPDRAVERDLPE